MHPDAVLSAFSPKGTSIRRGVPKSGAVLFTQCLGVAGTKRAAAGSHAGPNPSPLPCRDPASPRSACGVFLCLSRGLRCLIQELVQRIVLALVTASIGAGLNRFFRLTP
jgi:hypothetical protein